MDRPASRTACHLLAGGGARRSQMGDYAVLTYAATLDGAPLGEAIPDAPRAAPGSPERLDSSWTTARSCRAFARPIAGMNVNEETVVFA